MSQMVQEPQTFFRACGDVSEAGRKLTNMYVFASRSTVCGMNELGLQITGRFKFRSFHNLSSIDMQGLRKELLIQQKGRLEASTHRRDHAAYKDMSALHQNMHLQ